MKYFMLFLNIFLLQTLCFSTGFYPINSNGSSESYTNSNPCTETVGGIVAGTTFNNVSMTDMWNMLLYSYQYPAFTSFSINGQISIVEVGSGISGPQTFIWNASNPDNINANSINIYDITSSQTLFTGLANTGSQVYNFTPAIILNDAGSYIWQILGTNTQSNNFTKNYTVQWQWKRYWGTSSNASLNSTQILALVSNDLSTSSIGTFNFTTSNYKYYCIPSSFSQPTHFIDNSTGFVVDMQPAVIVSVTNINGITTNYSVYRTTYMLSSAITISIS